MRREELNLNEVYRLTRWIRIELDSTRRHRHPLTDTGRTLRSVWTMDLEAGTLVQFVGYGGPSVGYVNLGRKVTVRIPYRYLERVHPLQQLAFLGKGIDA